MEITQYLADCIRNKTPVSFSKYGDGEYAAANGHGGANCDRDTYTNKLSERLRAAFTYMIDEAPNTYIGIWHDGGHIDYWSSLVQKPIRVAKYHTIIMDADHRGEKVDMFKAIKESDLKKIYICNPLMVRAKPLLNIDYMIHVPFNNWFDEHFDSIFDEINKCIGDEEQCIILTSAGMGAKVVIAELSKKYPQNIYLDIGSGLDKVCTKKTSRGWEPSYNELMGEFRDLLPIDWESGEYQCIFDEAREKLGVHAPWLNNYD
jgi:hypothetical protein